MHKRIAGLLVLILVFICTASFAENSITAGDKVTFGKYPQHMKSGVPADPEPISWLVLDVDGDKVLLLSERALVSKDYNSPDHFLYEVTWETCTLRAWLNNEFLNEAFSYQEQQAIIPTKLTNPSYVSGGFVVSGGNDTTDKVFLLSKNELEIYLTTKSSRQCYPTDYASSTGAFTGWSYIRDDSGTASDSSAPGNTNKTCVWWLRSPGQIGFYAAGCDHTGNIFPGGEYVAVKGYSVRPAVWVLSSAMTGGE